MINSNPWLMQQQQMMNKQKQEEQRKKDQEKQVAESGAKARREIEADFDAGEKLGKKILGDGLGRIRDDADVQKSRDLMATRAAEGLSQREEDAIRDKALTQMGGAEQGQRRALAASLARSGVKGGTAGQMQVELAAQALQNRRAFETDLIMNDEATKRKSEMDFANFTTKLADFDLGQAAKEKNIMLQTQLATAQLGSTERGATKNMIAQENAAKAKGGGGGTVLCTAMFKHGFITRAEWGNDVKAGMDLYRNKKTRPGFTLYNVVCGPLAQYAIRNKWAAQILRPFIVPISKHFTDGNIIGTVLYKIMYTFFYISAKIFYKGLK